MGIVSSAKIDEVYDQLAGAAVSIPDGDSFLREEVDALCSSYGTISFNPRWG